MNGLTQSYLFKERLLKCEPIDLGRYVVDLRERHYWIIGHLILIYIQESTTANASLTINDAPSQRGPWSHIRHTPFLDTCSLIFLVMLFAVWLASDFVPRPYELKLWPGLTIPPLLASGNCDLCSAHDVQDEQYVLFHCAHPHVVSLGRTYLFIYSRRLQ